MALTVDLQGTLLVKADADNISKGDSGQQFGLHLQGVHESATIENSQSQAYIDSAMAFVALPISSNMQGTMLFLSMNDGSAKADLRVTYSVTGAVTFPFRGQVILEADATDYISLVEFQGTGTFDWVLTGVRS